MIMKEQHTEFFTHTDRGHAQRTLTGLDISNAGGRGYVTVIIALFVIQYIEGGSATHLGLAVGLSTVVAAISSPAIGRWLDQKKGYLDELWTLFWGALIFGVTYIFLAFATEVWHLYLGLVVIGIARSFYDIAWRVLFYNSIKKRDFGETVGLYQTFHWVGEAILLGLAGVLGEMFGFQNALIIAGMIFLLGALFPLNIRYVYARHPNKNRIVWK